MSTMTRMSVELREIALEIQADFGASPAYYAAAPYVEALLLTSEGSDAFYEDDLDSVILYLKGNLKAWRGEKAREIKARLSALPKGL